MHAFPILYSRNKSGSVQQWQIFANGNTFWTESGQLGGTITRTDETTCEGKSIGRANETTPEAQALSEAESRFDKKKRTHNFENICDIDKVQFIEPMLAKGFLDRKDKVKYPLGVQLKFNGVRCIATQWGLFTRKGEKYISVPHIWQSLDSVFSRNPDAVIDGELFNFDLRQKLNELVKLCRKTKKVSLEDLSKSERMVRYYCYDGYNFDGIVQDDFYRQRAEGLKKLLKDNPYYRHVQTTVAKSEDDVMRLFGAAVDEGHEGVIVRTLDAGYTNGRCSDLLKLKPTDDDEFLVKSWKYGSGNWSKVPKTVTCVMDDGREFDATFKGSMEEAQEFLSNIDSFMNKRHTIYYNGFTGLGKPNYAQFDYKNCNKGDR